MEKKQFVILFNYPLRAIYGGVPTIMQGFGCALFPELFGDTSEAYGSLERAGGFYSGPTAWVPIHRVLLVDVPENWEGLYAKLKSGREAQD